MLCSRPAGLGAQCDEGRVRGAGAPAGAGEGLPGYQTEEPHHQLGLQDGGGRLPGADSRAVRPVARLSEPRQGQPVSKLKSARASPWSSSR